MCHHQSSSFAMRLHSTFESVRAGEITWLAIAECALSTALYLAISHYLNTFHYYVLAIALAPIALLRTDAAVEWALERYEGYSAFGVNVMLGRGHWHALIQIPFLFFVYTLIVTWGFIYRIWSVAYGFFRRPVEALRQMPRNWVRQTLCVDLCTPPEIVPGEDAAKWRVVVDKVENVTKFVRFEEDPKAPHIPFSSVSHMPTFRRVFRWKSPVSEPEDWHWRLIRLAFGLLLFGPAYLAALFYRTSIKATCVVYAPLVWVAGVTAGSTDPLKLRLERIKDGEFEKTRRLLAVMVASLAVAKFALNLGLIGLTEAAQHVAGSVRLASEFLAPDSWAWWQLALVCDAVVTFCLLWFADAALSRIDTPSEYPAGRVAGAIAVVTFARAASAVAVVIYLVAMAVVQVVPKYIRFCC